MALFSRTVISLPTPSFDIILKVAKAKQKTKTEALTGVSVLTKTGKNKANWNTGSGTTVKTGGATTDVLVTVDGGSNTLNP
jgi:hypothetical protein